MRENRLREQSEKQEETWEISMESCFGFRCWMGLKDTKEYVGSREGVKFRFFTVPVCIYYIISIYTINIGTRSLDISRDKYIYTYI